MPPSVKSQHEHDSQSPLLALGFSAGTYLAPDCIPVISNDSKHLLTNDQRPSGDQADQYALPTRQFWAVVCSLYTSAFLGSFDVTVVTTLLTTIANDLKAVQDISWIASAYLLSSAAAQPLYGKISDIFGRKPVLLVCCAFFGVGCFFCTGPSLWWIVFGRLIAGIGGSGFSSLSSITMSDLIPLRDRGFFQGLANIFFGLGAASGGVLGGVLSDWLGWRYVFILQIPLTCLVAVAYQRNLNLPAGSPGLGAQGQDVKTKLKRIDYQGSFSLITCLLCLMMALSFAGKLFAYQSYQFVGLMMAFFIMFSVFIYVKRNVAEEPILPLNLMANRTILASSLTNWFLSMSMFALLFYVPVYFTSAAGLSATSAGLRLVSNFLGVATGSVTAGLYMRKTGKYYWILVVAVGAFSIVGYVSIMYLSPTSPLWFQYVLLFPLGFGYASMLTVTLLALIAAAPVEFQARTTSIQYTFRSTGSTIGVSVASAVFQKVLKASLHSSIFSLVPNTEKASEIIKRALEDADYVKQATPEIAAAIQGSYGAGCKAVFTFALITACVGYGSSLFMREHLLHTTMDRD